MKTIEEEDLCCTLVLEETKVAATELLREALPAEFLKLVERMIRAGADRFWFAEYHLRYGMTVRNILRSNGFGEADLPIENLDFIYSKLLERAAVGEEVNWEAKK